MARRTLKAGLLAGTLALALVASACGDSKENSTSTTKPTGSGTAGQLAKVDCGKLKYDKNAPSGGTFTDYAYMSDSANNVSFDPGYVQTLNEAQITTAMWDGLTDFDFTEKCAPVLKGNVAESWKANADATEYTFKIKKGLEFSDGEPVLPSSFKSGWERGADPALASYYSYLIDYIKGGAELRSGCSDDPAPDKPEDCKKPAPKTLDAIVADDDAMTLKVTLKSPNADFPSIVSHTFFSPVAKDDLAKIGATTGWGTKGLTIGNGPYKLQKADSQEVILVPNEKWAGNVYGDTKVKSDKIVFKSTKDVATAYQAFDAGEGDSAPVPPGQYGAAQAAYKNNSITDPNLGVYYWDFGSDDPQVGGKENVKLRQAISLAIDRDEINKKIYEGTRTVTTGLVPPGTPGYTEGLCHYCALDVAKAKKLYQEWQDAGGKLTKPIKLNFNEGGGHGDVATIMQANLKDNLGIETELAGNADTYFQDTPKPGGCNICRSGWYADYPTYGNFMYDLFSKSAIDGNNFGRFDDPKFEALLKKAQAEPDDVQRGKYYNEAESYLLNDQTVALPMVWYTGSQVYRDNVENFDQPPLGLMLWERISAGS